jgi:hypothetical protein
MKLELYAFRDKFNGFGGIQMYTNEPTAIRDFAQRVNNVPDMVFCPSDYDLYKIGEYDSETAEIKPLLPKMITTGASVIQKKEE